MSKSDRFPKPAIIGAAARIAIIGGGVCGLGIGWRLAAAGHIVTIYERDRAGVGASQAAAGMLAAAAETEPGGEALLELGRLAQHHWPCFADALTAQTGIAVDRRTDGTIIIALTKDDLEALAERVAFQRDLGVAGVWLRPAELAAREAQLAPSVGGVFHADDHQLCSRAVTLALKTAFVQSGGTLVERAGTVAVDQCHDRVRGVIIGEQLVTADHVVVANGAWAADMVGLPATAVPPIRPLKGQSLTLQMDPAHPILRHVLWTSGVYFAPKSDGRLIVGATVEEAGFDQSITAGGVYALLESARRALPSVDDLPLVETRAGLRPTSRDDAPLLGPLGGVDGLWIAAGHHRNGFLLAPVTADLLAAAITSGVIPDSLRPFLPDRFAAVAPNERSVKRPAA